MFTGFVAIFIFPTVKDGIISQNMKKSTLCDLNYANAKKYSYKAYTGTVAYIPYLYDTEVNEDGSVLSGKIGIEYVDAPNIFPVTWKNGEVSECIFAFGWAREFDSWILEKYLAGLIKPAFFMSIFYICYFLLLYDIIRGEEVLHMNLHIP